MKTSGNGSIWPQFVYILISLPVPIFCKIGISNKVSRRSEEVSKKVVGWAFPIFFVWLPFGFHLEQALHKLFAFANVRFAHSREWFWSPVAPFAAALMLLAFLLWVVVVLAFTLWLIWIASDCPDEPIKAVMRLLK